MGELRGAWGGVGGEACGGRAAVSCNKDRVARGGISLGYLRRASRYTRERKRCEGETIEASKLQASPSPPPTPISSGGQAGVTVTREIWAEIRHVSPVWHGTRSRFSVPALAVLHNGAAIERAMSEALVLALLALGHGVLLWRVAACVTNIESHVNQSPLV
jgi:hypothetical protein